MLVLILIQKGAPDLVDIIGLLLGILLCLFALNAFIDWLMKKPWKKSGIPDTATTNESTNTELNQKPDIESKKQSDQTHLFIHGSLYSE